MGSTEFRCTCGFGFLNSTDNRSYTAKLLADQSDDTFWDRIDAAIEQSGPTPRDKADACMTLRGSLLTQCKRCWLCPSCKRLYITDSDGEIHSFSPDSDDAPDLLSGNVE